MISSLILKNKLCGILNKQLFVRFPLKFFQNLSFFLRNLSRFDYNQPRSRLSMHRFKKFKKRRHGRHKWNLKKCWKFRGIGLKLDVIKEEGAKEYLAEIENDDDSLDWDQCAKPNHILLHKNSATYFGLIKFPANFSPSELALQRLCHGRTLQQTFPSKTELQTKTIPTTTSPSTNFATNSKETSKTTSFPTEKTNTHLSSDSKRIDSQTYHKSPRKKKKIASSIEDFENEVLQRKSREEYDGFRKFNNGIRKIDRHLRFGKNFGNSSRLKRRPQKNRMRNQFIDDLTREIETNFIAHQEKSLLPNSSIYNKVVPIFNSNFEDASSKIKKSICNKTEIEAKLQFPHASSDPDQNGSSEDTSSSRHQSSSIEFNLKKLDLKIPDFEDIVKSGSGFFENSFKMFGRSIDNILGAWNLKDFAKIELNKIPQPERIFDLQKGLQTNSQKSANSLEIDQKCADFKIADEIDLKLLELDVDDLKNEGTNGRIMKNNDQLIQEDNALMKNQKSEPPPLRPPNQSPNNLLRSSIETKSISGPPQADPGTLPNYSVNMTSAVHRIFACCSSDVEGQVGQVRRRLMSGGGSRRWGNLGRGMVQLDHKSLWTEFVSDMIVNSRVRNVQISDG